MTVFDARLGLTVPDITASTHNPRSTSLTEDLAGRTAASRDGYAAREILADERFVTLATEQQIQKCRDLVQA